jgi:hypothetical protein
MAKIEPGYSNKGGKLNLDKYFPARDVVASPAVPTTITVDGSQYVLASAGQQRSGELSPQDNTLQHHVPSGVIAYNGEPHIMTPNGIAPYRPVSPYSPDSGQVPRWIKHPYSKGLSIFAGAAILGVFLLCLGIALYALVTAVIANALAIGMTIVAVFIGGLVLLGALTKSRHGYAPRR